MFSGPFLRFCFGILNSLGVVRVVNVGISVIFNDRYHTSEAESHCYAFGTLMLYPNSHFKLPKVCKEDEF